ncbi:Gag-pro-like protein [Gossypium australe]|uniref:Gag-pro-like protein n=1 Tax=Gossypium australe TaxID=47621 RepID=A0A5B6WSE2_9ROSI|nr:Gag-pro-like protein [Gossypium australe]
MISQPQQYQAGTSAPVNYPIGSGSNPGDNSTNPIVPDLDDMAEMDKARIELPKQLEDRCKWLEEKFKAMENADYLCRVDAKELSLVSDLALPPKCKTPEFEKYNGTSCPEAHITMFCRRMMRYINNDQLLIHCFQDSLIGLAAKCYMTDMTPDRITLQNMEKKPSESFRQYAKRDGNGVLSEFFNAHVVSSFYLKPMQPPFPEWYDANTTCEYHTGITGHSIENYTAFKKMIEWFIKIGIIRFDDLSGCNVAGNLLPNHLDQRVNAIIESGGNTAKTDVVKERIESRTLVQSLMDNKELEFFEDGKGLECDG